MAKHNPRVYLAGPDVFYPDAAARSAKLKDTCLHYGFEGVFPLDSELQLLTPAAREENGYLIYEANIKLIRSCQAILANVSPFRGPSLDAGTAFEIGYGKALGLDVVGYTSNLTLYKDRAKPDGMLVEDFGMIDNLMIHAALCGDIFATPHEALDYLAVLFESGEPTTRQTSMKPCAG
jgi:nucleoside 2-deoxyribosyltransferase